MAFEWVFVLVVFGGVDVTKKQLARLLRDQRYHCKVTTKAYAVLVAWGWKYVDRFVN